MSKDYDAIIVGARCAGSTTSMLLAPKGYRVLLVDRATFAGGRLVVRMTRSKAGLIEL